MASGSIAELPDAVSFAQGAALPTAGLAALRMLRLGPAILGRRVLITGASGGVGRFAIQLAHRGGAEVTALVSEGSARSAGLRELGADDVVADIAQLRGRFDLILESVGGATLGRLVTIVDPDGTLVMFGNSSNEPTTFDVRDVFDNPSSSAFRDSNCSSETIRSVATFSTSRRWWARASSIRNSQGHCRGTQIEGAMQRLQNRDVAGKVALTLG